MLVLSRKIGESIQIGDNVTVTILDINRGQVRIGIAAPKTINILREELLIRDAAEDAEAKIDSNTVALDRASRQLQPRIGMRKPQLQFEASPR